MSLRTIHFIIVATSLASGAARAQTITPVSFSHQAESFARLDWTNPLTPDSTATDFDSGTDFGESNATALANNNGITSVAAQGNGSSGIVLDGDGYAVIALGFMQGHSNLAAIADASFASTVTMVFDIDQSVLVSLDCYFQNFHAGTISPGVGGGQASTSLMGPGGQSIFSYTNAVNNPNQIEFTELRTLQPGQYTLTVQSSGSLVFANGTTDFTYVSHGLVIINVPAPGGIALLALCTLTGPRRRL